MPDPALIALAASLAGIVAAAIVALAGVPWRASHPKWLALGSAVSAALGFAVGCGLLKVAPDWPPLEDRDRLLALILPGVAIIELIAAAGAPWWLAWALRLAIACATPRVLLHGTVYLDTPSGGESLAWSPAVRWTILCGLALALATAWTFLVRSFQRKPTRTLPLALGLTCCGAGLAVMLTGYASGGQLGPILGGALIGGCVSTLLLTDFSRGEGAIGFGLVGLFSLLAMGRYFGELSSMQGIVLFAAPLFCLVPLESWMPRWPKWAIAATKLVFVLLPLGVVIVAAGRQFVQNSQPATAPGEEGAADYSDYGS